MLSLLVSCAADYVLSRLRTPQRCVIEDGLLHLACMLLELGCRGNLVHVVGSKGETLFNLPTCLSISPIISAIRNVYLFGYRTRLLCSAFLIRAIPTPRMSRIYLSTI